MKLFPRAQGRGSPRFEGLRRFGQAAPRRRQRLACAGAALAAFLLGFAVTASCSAASSAASGSFYVNCNSGSDSAAGTSPQTAWKSLTKVSNMKFGAGSTVFLADGCQWDGGVTLNGNGTAASRITLTSYGSGPAPIVNNSQGHIVTAIALGGDYMTVSGLRVTDATGPGVEVQGTHGIVRGMTISHAGEGVEDDGADVLITGNAASNLIMENNTSGGDADYGAVGYDISASNATVTHNRCVNCKAPSNDFIYDGGFVEVWNQGDNLYVADNWAQNTEGFIEVGGDSNGTHANNITIVNNVLDNTDDVAILHYDDAAALPATDFVFEQNTVYQTGPTVVGQLFTWSPDVTETFRNNIFDVDMKAGSVPTTHTNNLYYENGGKPLGYALGADEKIAPPQFADADPSDFHLTADSPARGLGAPGLSIPSDFAGVARPGTPDAGAYQYTRAGDPAASGRSGSEQDTHQRTLKLRLLSARVSRRAGAAVKGTASKSFSGRIVVSVGCRASRSSAHRRPRKGRFSAHLKLPRACRTARTARVSVKWRGSRRFARQQLTRRVRIRS